MITSIDAIRVDVSDFLVAKRIFTIYSPCSLWQPSMEILVRTRNASRRSPVDAARADHPIGAASARFLCDTTIGPPSGHARPAPHLLAFGEHSAVAPPDGGETKS
jgi:hypothetical protein